MENEAKPGDDDARKPPPILYYLRTFHAVASERSFTRAGRTLSLSQPAVSAHIRTLERYYGGPLFLTRQRRVYLTAEGDALFGYTERVFNLLDEANRAVAAAQRGQRGLLRLGASTTIGVYLLPQLLRQYTAEYPGVEVDVEIGTSAEIIARVLAEDVPFGIVEAPITHRSLDVEAIGQDVMVLIAPRNHPLAECGSVNARQLADVPLLRREAGSATQALVDAALERSDINPPTCMLLGSAEALKQAVLSGLGLAWVPHVTVVRELRLGELAAVPVMDLSIGRQRSLVMLHGARLSSAAKAFLELVRHAAGRE
jgi:DNA-binding transcriptional LysR family regulator